MALILISETSLNALSPLDLSPRVRCVACTSSLLLCCSLEPPLLCLKKLDIVGRRMVTSQSSTLHNPHKCARWKSILTPLLNKNITLKLRKIRYSRSRHIECQKLTVTPCLTPTEMIEDSSHPPINVYSIFVKSDVNICPHWPQFL